MRRIAIVALVVATLAAGAGVESGAQPAPGDALAAHYPFSGNALDASPNGNHASMSGAVLAPDRLGTPDAAYSFDGDGAFIEAANVPARFVGDFTVAFWQRATSTTRMHALSLGQSHGDNLDFDFNDGQGNGLWVFWNSAGANGLRVGRTGEFTDGAWHRILLQRLAGQVQLYIDNVLRGTVSYSEPIGSTSLLRIGRSSAAPPPAWPYSWEPYWWAGLLDDVRIYGRALAPAPDYQWASTRGSDPTYSLGAFYPLNGDARDESLFARHGTVVGATMGTDRFGRQGAASFAGNGSIDAPGPGEFPGDFSVSFWERAPAGSTARMHAVSVGRTASSNIDFDFNGGVGLWVFWSGGGAFAIKVGAIGEFTDGLWHHIALQRSTGIVQLFIDGVLRGQRAFDGPMGSTETLRIGRSSAGSPPEWPYTWGPFFWTGEVDDVRVFTRALSLLEVRTLVASQFPQHDCAGLVSFKDKLWMLGGWNPYTAAITNSEVWSSTDGSDWTFATRAPWAGRHCAGYAVFGDKLWVVGGDNNSGYYQSDIWSSPDGVQWTQVAADAPWRDRVGHSVVAFNDRLWVLGGQTINMINVPGGCQPANETHHNDVWSTADGVTWIKHLDHAPWSPRAQILGSVVFGGRMWIVGGGTYCPRQFFNDVWSSADGVTWTSANTSAPWDQRQYHNVAVFDGKIWVLGGYDGQNLNDVWHSADGVVWNQLPTTPWIGRHAADVAAHGGALRLAAGSTYDGYGPRNDAWALTRRS